jgi:3-dehydroquinate synthase
MSSSAIQPPEDSTGPGESSSLRVSLGDRSYTIFMSSGNLVGSCRRVVDETAGVSHVVLVADQSVSNLANAIADPLKALGKRIDRILVPSGEAHKSVEQLAALWNRLLELKTDRASLVMAIGGGVIGDLAGFAAASFARGLRFIQVPTTLLAMVDSSVGGKTGINLAEAKNMVGAFWQPSAVVIDTAALATLPDREYRSGLAEIVKYGVILDAELFGYLEAHASAILARQGACLRHIIARSCELKASVVEQDERETTGLRAILNYGHTFAHAIEAATEYGRWLHGEAVAIGMTMAARLAVELKLLAPADAQRQQQLLERLQLPIAQTTIAPEKLWGLMQHDKKVEQGRLRFILPTRIGHVERRGDVSFTEAISAMTPR